MDFFRRSLCVSYYHIKRDFLTIKNLVIFLLLAVYTDACMEQIREACVEYGEKATPMGFIFLLNDDWFHILFLMGFLMLICKAPFREKSFSYISYRSGMAAWEMGSMCYIFLVSAVYTIFLVLLGILGLHGNVQFTLEWGGIWKTISLNDAVGQSFSINPFIIGHCAPKAAFWMSILLEWLCLSWLGMLIYLMNALFRKGSGLIAAGLLIFADIMIYNDGRPWMYGYSPVTMSHIGVYFRENIRNGVVLSHALRFYIGGIALMMVCMLLKRERKEET